jgi:hypothetical protein
VLRRHRIALALVEIRGMPHPADVVERMGVQTTDFFYARLIGDRSAVERITKTLDRFVLDRSASLGRWAHLLRVLAASADGFVYANWPFASLPWVYRVEPTPSGGIWPFHRSVGATRAASWVTRASRSVPLRAGPPS